MQQLIDIRRYIVSNESWRRDVYEDSLGIPTTGVGFNLERGDAQAKIEDLGLDYPSVCDAPANQPVLTDAQVDSLFSLHFDSDERAGSLCFDRLSVTAHDVVFLFGLPSIHAIMRAGAGTDFAYCEWRAALDAALGFAGCKVVNGSWLLNNASLRFSDVYWSKRVSDLVAEDYDPHRFRWQVSEDFRADDRQSGGVEIVLTRRRWVSELPNLLELSMTSTRAALERVQSVLIDENLDFLRMTVDALDSGGLKVVKASAELPRTGSSAFLEAMYDVC
jgi:hypothetical protein